jgi:hypothetical protein
MEASLMAGNSCKSSLKISVAFVVVILILILKSSPPQAALQDSQPAPLFQPSNQCMACHNGLVTASGEDVSFGLNWRASIMANSARDPYWQASVRREIIDHPTAQQDIESECSKCHMPMASFEAKRAGKDGSIFTYLPIGQKFAPMDNLAADGVSCALCHQIDANNLGEPSSFTGGFLVDTSRTTGHRTIYGPFDVDSGRTTIMRSATGFVPTKASHLQKSEVCATCHTLITHALNSQDQKVGELPEQIPYEEWLNSAFRDSQSCQSCHMPVVKEPVRISSVLGEPRNDVSKHVFTGGNFFMLRMLNRYRNELGVEALPEEFEASAIRTVAFLQNQTATVSIEDPQLNDKSLRFAVTINNLAGHKFPTAYPSRRAWLQLTVSDRNGKIVFESGEVNEKGMIHENDNDMNPALYERHHQEIDTPDEVQVYESIMVTPEGAVTTGLLSGVRFIKDNRILPAGFDKINAKDDIAVRGDAAQDPDFVGGSDRVRFIVNVLDEEGPFQIEVKLWYQPIAFRWADNLRIYNAEETRRFVSYYDSMAAESAIIVAKSSAQVP